MIATKHAKKVISLALALLMTFSLMSAIPTQASAAKNETQVNGVSTSAQANAQVQANDSRRSAFAGFWSRPQIKGIDPVEGPVGTIITLTGKKFNEDSVVRFGNGVVTEVDVSSDGKSLTFKLPKEMGQYCPPFRSCIQIAYQVEPGKNSIRVQNGFWASNKVTFEVTDEDKPLVIDSVTGPSTLDVDEEGTWNLGVTSNTDGNLSYSVIWGDEANTAKRASLVSETYTHSSTTFTHTYTEPGTYQPQFTVTDEEGNTVTKLADKVKVGDDTTLPVPTITEINPLKGVSNATVTISGTGFTSNSKVKIGTHSVTKAEVQSDNKIVFTVPALSLGVYGVTVTNDGGVSNSVNFEIIAKAKVSISSITAPTKLIAGQEGIWTINAKSNQSGNLKYSVDWGDTANNLRLRSSNIETQSSATFTYTYDNAGTFKPKFMVTDEYGNTTSVSTSVVVSTPM